MTSRISLRLQDGSDNDPADCEAGSFGFKNAPCIYGAWGGLGNIMIAPKLFMFLYVPITPKFCSWGERSHDSSLLCNLQRCWLFI